MTITINRFCPINSSVVKRLSEELSREKAKATETMAA